jgi:hypothetical protein
MIDLLGLNRGRTRGSGVTLICVRRTAEDYIAFGERALGELVEREHAFVWAEAEAKIADRRWEGLPVSVDPHHLTRARFNLLRQGVLEEVESTTRGGRTVTVYIPADLKGRNRAVQDAAARKRLLEARYLGWASGSKASGGGIIGPAGEAIVHASLIEAAPYGYRLINPGSGEVRTMLGAQVPGGSLDNGAFLTVIDAQTLTPDPRPYVVLIEVKNVRGWIYPSHHELHQLLNKAAALQNAHPRRSFLPVLVCARAHYLTNLMAEHMGFYVISMKRQYIRPSVEERLLEEVREELGYLLEAHESAVPAMVRHFTTTLQGVAPRTADRWALAAPHVEDPCKVLRNKSLTWKARAELTDELADIASEALGVDAPWRRM